MLKRLANGAEMATDKHTGGEENEIGIVAQDKNSCPRCLNANSQNSRQKRPPFNR